MTESLEGQKDLRASGARSDGSAGTQRAGERELWPIRAFVIESNRIEGITRNPTAGELREHEELLRCPLITVEVMERFVRVIAPGKPLRREPGMNVRVGNHLPPPGGPDIPAGLDMILDNAMAGVDPFTTHQRYETLHPFMDGNGRSGRALWLWQMIHQVQGPYVLQRGFLHTWYYQSLSAERLPPQAAGEGS